MLRTDKKYLGIVSVINSLYIKTIKGEVKMKRILVGAVVAVALSLGNSLFSADAAPQKFNCDLTKKADTKSGFTQEWTGIE